MTRASFPSPPLNRRYPPLPLTVFGCAPRRASIRTLFDTGAIAPLASLALISTLSACQPQVSPQQLDQWRQEAIAENDQLLKAQNQDLTKTWQVKIQGQVPRPFSLTWPQIEQLATAQLASRKPFPDSPKTPSDFRGLPVAQLLERAGVQVRAEENLKIEVTLVAADAYHSVSSVEKIAKMQGLLAIAENGKPIRRNDGGPIQMVFANPNNTDPGDGWVYYVTHVVVGTEAIRLQIGTGNNIRAKILDRKALEQMPRHSITTLVGYKHGWSSEPVQLTGVKLRDLLRAQNIPLPPQAAVRVRRKAMDRQDPQKSTLLSADLINRCDVMLVDRWGPSLQQISARKGGPLTLAYGRNCEGEKGSNLAWLPFVEAVEVELPKPVRSGESGREGKV
jgi:DMSO/TMAO reductase YedYZ molybdopterin-dependent catalytic subunit